MGVARFLVHAYLATVLTPVWLSFNADKIECIIMFQSLNTQFLALPINESLQFSVLLKWHWEGCIEEGHYYFDVRACLYALVC